MNKENDIIEFCENGLAYLIDKGFKLRSYKKKNYVDFSLSTPIAGVDFSKRITKQISISKWDNMKDELIPFFTMINVNYNLIELPTDYNSKEHSTNGHIRCHFSRNGYSSISFYIESIINDTLIKEHINRLNRLDLLENRMYSDEQDEQILFLGIEFRIEN